MPHKMPVEMNENASFIKQNIYDIVPWSSREEWLEVYCKAFSVDMKQWKEAHNQICVWKARMQKLPMGIDLTVLLLSARIIEADKKVEYTEKGVIISSSIARFISLVVKIPQKKMQHAMPMHVMAQEIGLPKHLVDLRHEIVHAADSPIQSTTLHHALNIAWNWLKEFYWVPEETKFSTKLNTDSSQEHIEEHLSFKSTKDNVEELPHLLVPFLDDLDALVRSLYPEVPQNNTDVGSTQLGQSIGRTLSHYYQMDPRECIKAIVDRLLVVKEPPIIRAAARSKHSCSCGCTLTFRVVQGVRWLIIALHKLGALPRLIQHLMEEKTTETNKCHDLANEWICIVLSFLTDPETVGWKNCSGHCIKLTKERSFDWRWLVQMLLDKEDHKKAQLAFRIMEKREEFNKEEIEELRQLVAMQLGVQSDLTKNVSLEKCTDDQDTIYMIEHIIDKAKEISYTDGKTAELYKNVVFGHSNEEIHNDTIQKKNPPLGILPGQKYNTNFYKHLLLDYTSCSQNMDI